MGIIELLKTDLLSQNNSAVPYNGTPKHLNFNPRYLIISVAILRATNYYPKVKSSTVFWCLLYHMIGAL